MNEEREKVLEVKDLTVSFQTYAGKVQAVRSSSFDLYKRETLAIVGESGSGKSVTVKTLMGLLGRTAVIEKGSAMYKGMDLTKLTEKQWEKIRGRDIAMIFQDPLSSLNPIKKSANKFRKYLQFCINAKGRGEEADIGVNGSSRNTGTGETV